MKKNRYEKGNRAMQAELQLYYHRVPTITITCFANSLTPSLNQSKLTSFSIFAWQSCKLQGRRHYLGGNLPLRLAAPWSCHEPSWRDSTPATLQWSTRVPFDRLFEDHESLSIPRVYYGQCSRLARVGTTEWQIINGTLKKQLRARSSQSSSWLHVLRLYLTSVMLRRVSTPTSPRNCDDGDADQAEKAEAGTWRGDRQPLDSWNTCWPLYCSPLRANNCFKVGSWVENLNVRA